MGEQVYDDSILTVAYSLLSYILIPYDNINGNVQLPTLSNLGCRRDSAREVLFA